MNAPQTGSRIARWISIALHPVVTLFVLVVAASMRFGDRAHSLQVIALAVAIGFVPITIIMVVANRSGRWQNVDASQPKERRLLFAAAMFFLLLLVVALLAWSPASYLARGALAAGALLAIAWSLLRWIKLSLHVAFAAFSAVSLTTIDWRLAVIIAAALPLLAWSRLRLHRHSMREVIAGAAVGLLLGGLLLAG